MYVSIAKDMKYFESQNVLFNYYKVCEDLKANILYKLI